MDEKVLLRRILNDPILFKLSSLAREKGVPLYLVGGYPRDLLLGNQPPPPQRTTMDYDFVLPREFFSFISAMEHTLQFRFFRVGKEEAGTLTYRMLRKEMGIDVTFFQGENLKEDLQRRDFTINAIAISLLDGTCYWTPGALEDIEKRILRSVSPSSIDLDPLRMLRAIRYLCSLEGFTIDIGLEQEIASKKDRIKDLPGERIKMELDRILLSPRAGLGVRSLYELGLLLALMPELSGLKNLGQNRHHHLQVLPHVLLMIDKIPWAEQWLAEKENPLSLSLEDRLVLYYASLFHDLGKQDTYSQDEEGKVHFYHHESFSCERAKGIMERLRFSNLMQSRILHLIKQHMRILNLSSATGASALKRLIHQMGKDLPLLVLHTLADKEASRGILSIEIDEVVEGHCLRILKLFNEKDILHPPLLLNGHDMMALGIEQGPRIGQMLNFIREKQLEGEIRTREQALKFVKEKMESCEV